MAKSLGIIGFGPKIAGQIVLATVLDENISGKIVAFSNLAHQEDILKAQAMGATGFICPGMDYREFIVARKQIDDFPVVLTEGFGFPGFSVKILEAKAEIDGEAGKIII